MNTPLFFVKNAMSIGIQVSVCIPVFSCFGHISRSKSSGLYGNSVFYLSILSIYPSIYLSSQSLLRNMNPKTSFLFFKIVLAIWSFLTFYRNFRPGFAISGEKN